MLETDQRRAIATALSRQVSIISGGPGVGKTTSIRILVDLLEQRGVPYMLLSPTGKAAKRLSEATLRDAYTIHRQLFSLERQKEQLTASFVVHAPRPRRVPAGRRDHRRRGLDGRPAAAGLAAALASHRARG